MNPHPAREGEEKHGRRTRRGGGMVLSSLSSGLAAGDGGQYAEDAADETQGVCHPRAGLLRLDGELAGRPLAGDWTL